ncbi:MAG: methionine--tRNA ligase [Beijerinckiaceae bacterium]
MTSRGAFYITTAISYPNGAPHIGHAYELIAADAIARFKRLDGYDVFFMTGTDEHGLKMVQTAEKAGIDVRELADRNALRFKQMGETLHASPDRFIRTTEPRHYASCQELWRRMKASGDIYLDQYEGWYSVREEAYYDEKELSVAADGSRLSPQGTPVEWVREQNYKFRLSAYADRLLALYESPANFISPETRKNEVVSFVKGGLQDFSVSRTTFKWGVPVPDDDAHVMYVWADALTNYITGVGFPDESHPDWRRWPADVHIIGKDIIRFHAVYWPAMLMSAGLPTPRRVFGHGFVLSKGEKMSKSVGNVVDPFDLVKAYGVDQVRYFFLREVAFGQDGNYSPEAIANRINADLANDLGNLAQRSLSMIAKGCEGKAPARGPLSADDQTMLALAHALPDKLRAAMEDFALHQMLNDIWAVTGEANRYFAAQEPWKLAKTDTPRRDTVLSVTVEILRCVGIAILPFMPSSAIKLLDLLAVPTGQRMLVDIDPSGTTPEGTELPAPVGIFPRYVEPEAPAA